MAGVALLISPDRVEIHFYTVHKSVGPSQDTLMPRTMRCLFEGALGIYSAFLLQHPSSMNFTAEHQRLMEVVITKVTQLDTNVTSQWFHNIVILYLKIYIYWAYLQNMTFDVINMIQFVC